MVRITVSNSGIDSISSPRTSYSPKVSNRFQPLSGSQSARVQTEAAKPGLQRAQSWPSLNVSFDLSKNKVVPFEMPRPASPAAATPPAKQTSPTPATPAKTTTKPGSVEKGSSWRMPSLFNAAVIVASVFLSFRSAPSQPNGLQALPNSPAPSCPNQHPVSTHQPMLPGSTAAQQLMISGRLVAGMLPAPGSRPVEYSVGEASEVPNSTPPNGVQAATMTSPISTMTNPISTEAKPSAAVKATVKAVNATQSQNSTRKASKPKQRKVKIQKSYTAPAVIAPMIALSRGTATFEYPRAAPPGPRTNFFRSY